MKIELSREEVEKALTMYLEARGVCSENDDVKISIGKGSTTATIKERKTEKPEASEPQFGQEQN